LNSSLQIQTIEKHSHEATIAIRSNAGQSVQSSKADVASEEITEEHPTSLPISSDTEMSCTEAMLDASRSVPPCQAPVEGHTEAENDHDFDGPRLSAHRSFSQICGEVSIQQLEKPGNNSAHIAYSGSISIRSDSSATSARSFAFPM
jgi:hypothetical protein